MSVKKNYKKKKKKRCSKMYQQMINTHQRDIVMKQINIVNEHFDIKRKTITTTQ